MTENDQSEAIAFLSRPEAFGVANGVVEKTGTHISLVFLLGKRALKLKRAVRFPFLDFSTAKLRRRYCEAEVKINRRTAPDLYRGVLPVTREPGGGLALDGEGEPIDWVIDMVRFDESMLLGHMARRKALDESMMWDMAQAIADFHAGAEVLPKTSGKKGLGHHIESNANSFSECPDGIFDPEKLARLTSKTRARLDSLEPLLETRCRLGKVRLCHGDLHLRNIVLIDGKPTLFDAIEFWDALVKIDTFFDVAFLIMDLEYRGMRRHASILMNAYLDLAADESGLGALSLFLSVRAATRAHVNASVVRDADDQEQAGLLIKEAREYLDLALDSLNPPPPVLVAVGGLSGSGKSHMSRQIAAHLGAAPGARVLHTDVIRKRLCGFHPLKRLPQWAYEQETTEQTYRTFFNDARMALRAGHSVITDAVFSKPDERAAIARIAEEEGVPFTGIWLEAPLGVREKRILGRKNSTSDASAALARTQQGYDLGQIDWARVDSSGTREETLKKGLSLLGLEGLVE